MPSRGRYSVNAPQVEHIITHRLSPKDPKTTQYLLCWKAKDDIYPPLSWHSLDELGGVLHLVQQYITAHKQQTQSSASNNSLPSTSLAGHKRKRSENQVLTPESGLSPSSKPNATTSDGKDTENEALVFNAVLQCREGQIIAMPTTMSTLDVRSLPTEEMKQQALVTDLKDAEHAIRNRYVSRLHLLHPPVSFRNDVDRETPSLAFKFITDYILRDGVTKRDDLILGCEQCKPNMGANRGCEYTKKCDCLEFAAPDLDKLDEDQRREYQEQIDAGENPVTLGLPKRFPYYNTGSRAGCLMDFYLSQRHVIYECNDNCRCGSKCKNRNVQHGRQVKLEIFKTNNNRGFGLRCLEPLKRGQFIDTYLGEIITDAEADRREATSGHDKASYLFSLDKFKGDSLDGVNRISTEDCFVVDGQFMGGPTRFMNHCCQPNVQIHSVSYNKYDYFVYDLAFFACDDIAKGEELTFDYMDADDSVPEQGGMDGVEREDGKTRVECRCGAEMCRRWLWT